MSRGALTLASHFTPRKYSILRITAVAFERNVVVVLHADCNPHKSKTVQSGSGEK